MNQVGLDVANASKLDVLIIGAGQCGIPLARRLAQEGLATGLAERRHVGGSCVNFGCTPTKAVAASARVAHLARRAAEYGVRVGEVSVDLPAVLGRARGMVAEAKEGLSKGLDKAGVVWLDGHARFAGRVGDGFESTVGDRTVTARRVVIDVGTRTTLPPIDGLAEVPYLHASNWLVRDELPAHVVVVGAGYIGLEMAQFYRRCGSDVTVIGSGEHVADREDPDVADALRTLLEQEGVRFLMGVKADCVTKADGGLSLSLDDGSTVAGTHLFLATGRTPNTDDLGLDTIGLSPEKDGTIRVDERLSTTVAGVWAAGDVRGGPMFTHSSWDDHRVLENQLLGDGTRTTAGRIVPYAIFTDPELGRVGLSETEARKTHDGPIRVATLPLTKNDKARQQGEPDGLIKLVACGKTDKLLGAAVLGVEGAELVGSYITLMNSGATLEAVCRGIYIHPTLTEAVQAAVSALDLGVHPTHDA